MGLLDAEGNPLALRMDGEKEASAERVLWLREFAQSFVFEDIAAPPTPSLLRGFSAPVKLDYPYGDDDLARLVAHDQNSFTRWDAAQTLAVRSIKALIADGSESEAATLTAPLAKALRKLLADKEADPALIAETLALPPEEALALEFERVDVAALAAARCTLKRSLAAQLKAQLLAAWERTAAQGPWRYTPGETGRRRLHGVALDYLGALATKAHLARAEREFAAADNMTDRIGALVVLTAHDTPARTKALARFRDDYDGHLLALDKWFALQATSPLPGAVERVRALMDDPVFTLRNPNRVRALIGSFAHRNHAGFHADDGAGYRFVADQVLALDAINPQVAARLVTCFAQWRRYDDARRKLMTAELERMAATRTLSRDVQEIIARSLARK